MLLCPHCNREIDCTGLSGVVECPYCGKRLRCTPRQPAVPPPPVVATVVPEQARYNPATDAFTGTMPQMVRLAMRAIQDIGWTISSASDSVGLVTFETGITWGSWGGVTCSLSIEQVAENAFRVRGTGKQNVRGRQMIALNLFGEAQSKVARVIRTIKQLASQGS